MYSSYTTINLNKFPGEMKVPGKTLIQQIQNTGYQDLYRNIQQMRNQDFAKEVKEGEFVPEFSGFGQTVIGGFQYTALVIGLFVAGYFIAKIWHKFKS